MAQLSINEVTTYRWSFEEDVERYVAAGIGAIGVWRPKLSDFGEEKGIELLADSGLKVSNLLWAGGFTGSDGRSHRDSIDDAAEAIRLAAALCAGCLVLYSGGRGGHTHQHARRLLYDALDTLIPLAERNAVTLAIEPMHAHCAVDWTFLTSLDDALQVVAKFRHDRLKIVLDTFHLGHECGLSSRLGEVARDVAIVHLGDGESPPDREQNRTRLGNGSLPLREITSALLSAGYDGYFDVELIGEEICADDYVPLLEHSKRAVSELCGCASR